LSFATQSSCFLVTQISRVESIPAVGRPLLSANNEASFSSPAPRARVDFQLQQRFRSGRGEFKTGKPHSFFGKTITFL
jgi:hypothetical protein